jgi:hypothetical protein
MLRGWIAWAIRFHFTTALAAAMLLLEVMQINGDSFSLVNPFFAFAATLGIYNGYRLVFQRTNLREIFIKNWPIRFQIRMLLIVISYVYVIFVWVQDVLIGKHIFFGLLFLLLYASSRIKVSSTRWLWLHGWIKAPLLALGWFWMTTISRDDAFPMMEVNSIDWTLNRFGLLILLALSNDVHDREKDAARGLSTWAVRFSPFTIRWIGIIIATIMLATTIGYAETWDARVLTETGLLHPLFGLGCFFLSFNRNSHFRHVLLMDASLMGASLLAVIANYLRNLLI